MASQVQSMIKYVIILRFLYYWLKTLFGSKKILDIVISTKRENHIHGFYCTQANSLWVAQYGANLIKSCGSTTYKSIVMSIHI